jgi:hypothetical protein
MFVPRGPAVWTSETAAFIRHQHQHPVPCPPGSEPVGHYCHPLLDHGPVIDALHTISASWLDFVGLLSESCDPTRLALEVVRWTLTTSQPRALETAHDGTKRSSPSSPRRNASVRACDARMAERISSGLGRLGSPGVEAIVREQGSTGAGVREPERSVGREAPFLVLGIPTAEQLRPRRWQVLLDEDDDVDRSPTDGSVEGNGASPSGS